MGIARYVKRDVQGDSVLNMLLSLALLYLSFITQTPALVSPTAVELCVPNVVKNRLLHTGTVVSVSKDISCETPFEQWCQQLTPMHLGCILSGEICSLIVYLHSDICLIQL